MGWILVLTVEEVSMDNDPLQDKVTAFTKMPVGVIHLHSIIHHAASHVLIKRSRVCHKKEQDEEQQVRLLSAFSTIQTE